MLLPLLLNLVVDEVAYSYGAQAAGASLSHGVQPAGSSRSYGVQAGAGTYRYDRDRAMS